MSHTLHYQDTTTEVKEKKTNSKKVNQWEIIFLLIVLSVLFNTSLFAQNTACATSSVRTMDGKCNNVANSDWGSAEIPLHRAAPFYYANGIDSLINNANPRALSNKFCDQGNKSGNGYKLSVFVYTMGQFIDHDITLSPESHTETEPVLVPCGDPIFDPNGVCASEIGFHRSAAHPGTGTSTSNPRNQTNIITAWLDGSMIYGSNDIRAAWLRSNVDGKLKVSEDNYLPCNTPSGSCNEAPDPTAPFMAGSRNMCGDLVKVYVAGDVRANEQPGLTILHTIFVREHNLLCEELKADHPTWTDEQLYQRARKINGAKLQAITYNEFLPALGIELGAYSGYNNTVVPNISSVFSTAAYRLGHTMVTDKIIALKNDCIGATVRIAPSDNGMHTGGFGCGPAGTKTFHGYVPLLDGFFNPSLLANNGIDVFLKGMSTQKQEEMDTKIVDNLRNFLFGPNAGLDLASLNIQRGRDHGLAPYNTYREIFTGAAANDFDDITNNGGLQNKLEEMYGTVDRVDAWVGMLLEDHNPNKPMGNTVTAVLADQFLRLRDGDRFWYQNDPELASYVDDLEDASLSHIIRRNSGATGIQQNVFKVEACTHKFNISGEIFDLEGHAVKGSKVKVLRNGNDYKIANVPTGETEYIAKNLPYGNNIITRPYNKRKPRLNVNLVDLILLNAHLSGEQPFTTMAQYISADVDNNNVVDATDFIYLELLIARQINKFPDGYSYRFLSTDNLPTVAELAAGDWSKVVGEKVYPNLVDHFYNQDFLAIKKGDITSANNFQNAFLQTAPLVLSMNDQEVQVNARFETPVTVANFLGVSSFQMSLEWDPNVIRFEKWTPSAITSITDQNIDANRVDEGRLTITWHDPEMNGNSLVNGSELINLQFTAIGGNKSETLVTIDSAQFLNRDANLLPLDLAQPNVRLLDEESFDPYNLNAVPNPFENETTIEFYAPSDEFLQLNIYNVFGQVIESHSNNYTAGQHSVKFDGRNFASGVYYYKLLGKKHSITKEMILAR